jgi:hypothetical protein
VVLNSVPWTKSEHRFASQLNFETDLSMLQIISSHICLVSNTTGNDSPSPSPTRHLLPPAGADQFVPATTHPTISAPSRPPSPFSRLFLHFRVRDDEGSVSRSMLITIAVHAVLERPPSRPHFQPAWPVPDSFLLERTSHMMCVAVPEVCVAAPIPLFWSTPRVDVLLVHG